MFSSSKNTFQYDHYALWPWEDFLQTLFHRCENLKIWMENRWNKMLGFLYGKVLGEFWAQAFGVRAPELCLYSNNTRASLNLIVYVCVCFKTILNFVFSYGQNKLSGLEFCTSIWSKHLLLAADPVSDSYQTGSYYKKNCSSSAYFN